MTTIALLPLDSRSYNLSVPRKIARSAGCEICTPPLEFLGDLKNAADSEALENWIIEAAAGADIFIISLDMLCFGGLIHSRKMNVSLDSALNRLEVIPELKNTYPHLKIYVFSIIMRPTITTTSEEVERYWKLFYEYSKAAADQPLENIERIKEQIPNDLLENFMRVRARNHEINKKATELIKLGDADFLILGKEDVAEQGFHRQEEETLRELIGDLNKVLITPGADELGQMLVARSILEAKAEAKAKAQVLVCYSSAEGARQTALYEDQPIRKTVFEHIEAVGAEYTEDEKSADLVFFVNTPLLKQEDLFLGVVKGSRDQGIKEKKALIENIKNTIDSGKRAAVADVVHANGADPEFMGLLLKEVEVTKLASFAAWNTCGNTIGTALAQGLITNNLQFTPPLAGQATKNLIIERLLDDYVYQSLVRPELIEYCRENGISIYDLGGKKNEVEKVLNTKMKECIEKHLTDYRLLTTDYYFAFPWDRLFEIEINQS
jgi:hypothetical protein